MVGERIGVATYFKDGLMPSSAFMQRGGIEVPSWNDLSKLDNIVTQGIYNIQPLNETMWGTLIVLGSNAIGCTLQIIVKSISNSIIFRSKVGYNWVILG